MNIDVDATNDEGVCSADSADPDPVHSDTGDTCMRIMSSDALQKVEEDKGRFGHVCTGHGQQDHLNVLTTGLFTRLCNRCHLYWLQHQGFTHL